MKKVFILLAVAITIGSCSSRSGKRHLDNMNQRITKLEKSSQSWALEPYQYVLTLEDSFWVTVRRADGSVLGQVWCDTTTKIGKLFYNDNQ